MYVSCIQFYVVSGNDVCRIGKAWESLVLLFAIPEVFFGIFLEGSLIDSRIGRVAAWYPHYLFLKAQATSACDMLFNFSSASIPIKHLILLFFVWKRTQLWWLFCWISLLICWFASVARLLFTVSSILLALSFITLTQVGDDCCGFQWWISIWNMTNMGRARSWMMWYAARWMIDAGTDSYHYPCNTYHELDEIL